jgi:hypothetical protein
MLDKIKEWIAKALDLLDRILEVLRGHLPCLKPYSPSEAPTKWIYINGACCMITAMFFLLGALPNKTIGYQTAETYYVPFNLLICMIWFAEASMWMIFDQDEPAWHKIGELGMASFFIVDAIIWVYEWLFTAFELHQKEILIYTAIDFFIYLFYLALAIRTQAKALLKEQQGEGDVECSGKGGTSNEKDTKTDFKLMA